jgi:hypothetical protein
MKSGLEKDMAVSQMYFPKVFKGSKVGCTGGRGRRASRQNLIYLRNSRMFSRSSMHCVNS